MDILSSNSRQRKICRYCQQEKSLDSFKQQGIYVAAVCLTCTEALPPVPNGMKRCSRCLEIKEISAFNMDRGKPYSYCRTCHRQYKNDRHDSEKRRDENLRRNYGITSEQYELMFLRQGGVCAACRRPETAIAPYTNKIRKLAVDHCHVTGLIRELLCETCNKLLGYLEKDPERVEMVVEYLKRHSP